MTGMKLPNYAIPKGMRVYAIGDLHGHLLALDAMHEAISADLLDNPPDEVQIVYMGDYIDRGPESRGVVERLIERKYRRDGIGKIFLTGNHELAMFDFMADPVGSDWLKYGGMKTLANYDITFENDVPLPGECERAVKMMKRMIPEKHLTFLKYLSPIAEIGDYLFVHAGIDPRKAVSQNTLRDLTTVRKPFLKWDEDARFVPLSHKIVHGHSVSEKPENKPHRIGVDTGCYQGGKLTAAVLEGTKVRFIQVG